MSPPHWRRHSSLADCGWIQPGEDVLLFNCATGLKYPLPD